MANPLVASAVDTTSPFSGAYLIEDGQALVDAVTSGNWVDDGMAAFSAALDTAALIVDPIGTLIANGLGWVLDHIEPLKGWLNDVTGDAGEVAAFAQTWRNVAGQVHDSADTFARRTHDLDGMSGATIDAYLAFAGDTIAHLHSTGDWANAIAGGLEVASQLVQIVHDLVRDAISQIVGTAISVAAEVALTVGFATPVAIGQITTKVASLATRVGKTITRLLSSLGKLKGLLGTLEKLFAKGSALVTKMLRGGSGAAAVHPGSASAASRAGGLTAAELAGLRDYTGPGYAELNQVLRGKGAMTLPIKRRIDAVSAALKKLPDAPGQVYRGTDLLPADIGSYVPGRFRTEDAFTSASRDPARSFPGNTIFIIDGTSGKDVAPFSLHQEEETLFDRGTRFYVRDNIFDPELDRHIIYLMER